MSKPNYAVDAQELGRLVETKNKEEFAKYGNAEGLANRLKTDIKNGLDGHDLEDRKAHFGINVLPPRDESTFFDFVKEGLEDKTLIMLLIAAVVSLGLGVHENPSSGWIEGVAIIIAVVVVVMVGATNNFNKEKQFRALNAKKENKNVKVYRNGELKEISVYDILVGDILLVETGDIIPADAVYVSGHGIKCDESAATGESDAIAKPDHDPFFISGSQVLEGYGTMMVTGIGINSFHGKTMMALRVEPEDTPLQQKLDTLADNIGKVGLLFAILTLSLLVIKYFLVMPGPFHFGHFFSHLVKYLLTAITMVVVAVPEGLPLAVTISLAYSMMKMLRDNNLVRHLAACETMGGATAICSDKTGTLTQNRMTVVQGVIAGTDFKDSQTLKSAVDQHCLELLCEGVAVNSTAYEGETDKKTIEFLGNKTECALLGLTKKLGSDYKALRNQYPVIELVPFSSARKSMCTVIQLTDKKYRCHVKGASEIVLAQASHMLNTKGEIILITDSAKDMMETAINTMASNALRTICLAYRDSDIIQTGKWDNYSSERLVVIGIVGIQDPLRPEVPAAVKACQQAGVVVRMVTGDNITTAINIAKNCGIFDETQGMIAMEGPKFRELTEDELVEILPNLRVLARSSPLDKQILVSKLKESGEVVAVTGDGTNDAPALKLAHVGFSMGIAGTEVAKEASDIILMDDNFSSIVKALLWGRNVYDAIRKFLQFQLTVNIVAVTLAFIGSLTSGSGESPLKPVQLLWVNLIMDTMAALALATEEPTPDLLNRKPYGKDGSGLITRKMWKNVIGQAIFQLFVNFGLLYLVPDYFGVEPDSTKHLTLFFNTFVLCQLFNEINSRKINDEINVFEGIFRNSLFIGIMMFTILMQFLIVEFGGEFTSTTHLNLQEWLFCIGIAFLGIPLGFLIRSIPVGESSPKAKPKTAAKSSSAASAAAKARWKGAISNIKKENSVLMAFKMMKKNKEANQRLRTIALRVRTENSIVSFLRKEKNRVVLSKIQLMEKENELEKKEN